MKIPPRKWFALLGLILFLGVAVAPSISSQNDTNRKTTDTWIFAVGNITGGLFIHAEVLNGYHSNLTNVSWNITVNGRPVLFGKQRTGVIENLPYNGKVIISSFVFGVIGNIEVIVEVVSPEYSKETGTATAKIFGPITYFYHREK